MWPSFQESQSALAFAYAFDLSDYSNPATGSFREMQVRLDFQVTKALSLRNLGAPSDLLFLLLLTGLQTFKEQIAKTAFVLPSGHATNDHTFVIDYVESRFRLAFLLPLNSLVLETEGD